MSRGPGAAAVLALLALPGWSCRAQSDPPAPQECAPPTSELSANSSADGISGEYQLRLVATSGTKAGATADGTLKLHPQSGNFRYRPRPSGATDSSVVHPLYGSAELDLSAVDAVLVGSTTSVDPAMPGVLVIQRRGRPGRPGA